MRTVFVLWVFLSSAWASPPGACALRVHIFDPASRPADVTIAVHMDDGRVSERESAHGIAEFCDLGWGAFSVVVGRNCVGGRACNIYTFRKVRL